MPKVLKFWHQWSWAFHIIAWIVMGTTIIVTYRDSAADNAKAITVLEVQHESENLNIRMTKQEQITQDINQNLAEIKNVQGKIFDRINTIADRGR